MKPFPTALVLAIILAVSSAPSFGADRFSAETYKKDVSREMQKVYQQVVKSGSGTDAIAWEIQWLERRMKEIEAHSAREENLWKNTGKPVYRETWKRLELEVDTVRKMILDRNASSKTSGKK